MTGCRVARSCRERAWARGLALVAAAALLACGVKAPPKPPEKSGVAGSKHDLRPPGGPDGGAAGADGTADAGRP